ncbi:phosphomannomutase [Yoonia maritima]|uniref:Phosphomannomutase n=2 Tax=Yoonia maritima TaxID=1435347 RepID=A0A2T0VW46_9RHOB|nr:phosphomannomutase [Yoonia maritima]
MPPKFGTSGLRGLVTELTPDCVAKYVTAFISACPIGSGIYVGHDLRESSPDIAKSVATAARDAGADVTMCGAVPTPALALASQRQRAAAIMVTGSHIPADRNGLKFYTPSGEITKAHEKRILASLGGSGPVGIGRTVRNTSVNDEYCARYTVAYADALSGMRIGLYGHSAVGRAMLGELLEALGADVVMLGWSDQFVPLDTEAIPDETRVQLRAWAQSFGVDAIVSTDGDGDRPMLTDGNGNIVPGDILGQITAQVLEAENVVTPVSSNTSVGLLQCFDSVVRSKIGSPFVIAAMKEMSGKTVGYEANGGFRALGPNGVLPPLMTRDAVLPVVTVLAASREHGVAELVAAQPTRFTAANRLQNVPTERGQALVQRLTDDDKARAEFLQHLDAAEAESDLTDGLRMTLTDGRIIHLRPSGNAPELRLYVDAQSIQDAQTTLFAGISLISTQLDRLSAPRLTFD